MARDQHSDLDRLLEKTVIVFPQKLTGDQVRDMWGYIVKKGKYEIAMDSRQVEQFHYGQQGARPVPDMQEIKGTITVQRTRNSAFFSLHREINYETEQAVFTKLEFDTWHDTVEEHRIEQRELWDQTRAEIIDYFDNDYRNEFLKHD